MGASEELAFKFFTRKMKKRLEEKSSDGYYGFETLTPVELEWKFQDALAKGNVVDIANYLMMLSYIGVDQLGKVAESKLTRGPGSLGPWTGGVTAPTVLVFDLEEFSTPIGDIGDQQ